SDVYGDGSLDLFVGGRVAPGVYPAAVSSRLFRNERGRFVLDTANGRLFASIGLISAAVFSDVNGDGWPDLILAPEWGSLKLFLNEHGSFRDATAEYQLDRVIGRWNGVTTGYLDGDGHEDVFLAQNFFPTALATPRYDAGRGLVLRGIGDGTLEPVPGQVSGILVYGDQRGAALADYDGDGRIDLVVSQNGAETKLYHNERARPGLRVRLMDGPLNPHGIGAVL